jgi:hypothetical protein
VFRKSEIECHLRSPSGGSVNSELTADSLDKAERCERETVMQFLSLPAPPSSSLPPKYLDPSAEGYIDLSSLLNASSEGPCQKALSGDSTSSVDGLLTLDEKKGIQEMLVNGNSTPNVSSSSGHIDLLSSKGPIFLEIKAASVAPNPKGGLIAQDLEVLKQILDRMFRLRCTYGQLKIAVGFAATPRTAWCLVFQRHLDSDDDFEEYLNVWRIGHGDIFPIWDSVAAASAADPSWFLTEDAPFINSCLMQLGYHPSLCGARLEKDSKRCRHKVYHISLPMTCQYSSGNRVLALPSNERIASIKVHKTTEDYEREAGHISRIRNSSGTDISGFYAYCGLPYVSSEGFQARETAITVEGFQVFDDALNRVRHRLGLGPDSSGREEKSGVAVNEILLAEDSLASALECVSLGAEYLHCPKFWNVIPLPAESATLPQGGVILMRPGRKARIAADNIWSVAEGVMKSLRLTHAAGLCHCDIRPSNILTFGEGEGELQLIDYDLSVACGGSFELVSGALFDNRGSRLRDYKEHDRVAWTVGDDYEMLFRFVRSNLQSVASEADFSTPPREKRSSV